MTSLSCKTGADEHEEQQQFGMAAVVEGEAAEKTQIILIWLACLAVTI